MVKEKGGFLTPKAIANRIKAKGLQKLRWYCQMCEKQCRDENGFKCHLMSESHQRQLLLFAENPHSYMSDFSREFLKGYLDLLKRQFGGKRTHANVIYQEYIKERDHIHMNATDWHTLGGFVQYLGKEGLCRVDHTEKGWFVEYIDRDPEKIRKQESIEKMSATEDEKMNKFFERQIKFDLSRQNSKKQSVQEYTELQRNEDEKISLNLTVSSTTGPSTSKSESKPSINKNILLEAAKKAKKDKLSSSNSVVSSDIKRPHSSKNSSSSALDEIIAVEQVSKNKVSRYSYWLHEGIVVKLISPKLGAEHRKKKARVVSLVDKYTAVVEILDTGAQLRIDQDHVETVIPNIDRPVLVLNGFYRGYKALLKKINIEKYSCDVNITEGPYNGKHVEGIPYEDISKLYTDDA